MRNEFRAWVLRANLTGFTAGCRLLLRDVPHFGDLVKVRLHPDFDLFGLIYEVNVRDDPVVRQLVLADTLEPELILDQRENRLAPIELGVLTVGYRLDGCIIQGLPPQPPINLDSLTICNGTELLEFTQNLTYLHLILNVTQIPSDELLVVSLQRAAEARLPELRYRFLVEAGQGIARLLRNDLGRLEGILKRIRPRLTPIA